MKTQITTNTTTTKALKARRAATTKAATKPDYAWRADPDALTWKEIGYMEWDEQEAALEARGFGDSGSEGIEAIIASTDKWIRALAHLSERRACSVMAVTREFFIHERSIRDDGESED